MHPNVVRGSHMVHAKKKVCSKAKVITSGDVTFNRSIVVRNSIACCGDGGLEAIFMGIL
jgi:hypothetical protein